MKLTRLAVTDGVHIEAGVAIEGEPAILVVEAEAGLTGLPSHIDHAYWERSGDEALSFAADHANDILRLIQHAISEPVEV